MKFEFSAGGIVCKKEQGNMFVLVCQHSGHHGWVFPKGLIDKEKGEKKEEASLREVREETGAVGKIVQPLTPETYWYQWEGERRRKTVYYFLMEFVSGDITDHDWEMQAVEWLPIDKVEERLTYASDKTVWTEAKQLLSQQ